MRLRAIRLPVALAAVLVMGGTGDAVRGAGTVLAAAPPAVAYEMTTAERRGPGCPPGGGAGQGITNCPHITFRYPVITRAPSPATATALTQAVSDFLLREVEGRRSASIDAALDGFMQEYEEYQKLPGARPAYWEERTVTVLYQSGRVFSLGFVHDWYYGGLHPNYAQTFANFDAATGERITLASIFVAGYQAPLNRIGEREFRRVRGLAPQTSLREAGFRFPGDRFAVNDNFAIGPKGLTFFYNPYEIAGYAMGVTELLLPYREIRDLIRPDGPLGPERS